MKKVLSLFVLATILLTLGFASATTVCATFHSTFVSGSIMDATNGNALVSGADVTVTCNGVVKTATSDALGGYEVQYADWECATGNDVSVSASWNGLNGNSDTITWSSGTSQIGCLELVIDVACGDVPLVPEFGLIAGVTAVLGALGTFFIVRKK